MTLEEFEACNGKPQTRSCCIKVTPKDEKKEDKEPVGLYGAYGYGAFGVGWDYDDDDGYFRHVAHDSVRERDHYGFPLQQRTQKALTETEIKREK